MSDKLLSLCEITTCTMCGRSRRYVPALVRMERRCICSECVAVAAEALINHYHPVNPFAPPAADPVPA